MLHSMTADPVISRASLTPQQFELVETVEKAEAEFIELILSLPL